MRDDDQDPFPSRPYSGKKDPKGPVGRSNPGLSTLLGEGCELLAKSEFNDCLFASASKESRNTAQEDPYEFEQMPHWEAHSGAGSCGLLD
jgi:hypothetical protein